MKLTTLFPALKYKNFRLCWYSEWLALVGFWLQLTALQWYVYELTNSAFLLGLFSAMEYAPSLLLTLPAGVWVDRYDKRKILIGTQLMYIALAALLGFVLKGGAADYEIILIFAFLFGTVDAVDAPARLSFIPELVDSHSIHSAISLNSANFNITRMIGPPLATMLLARFSYSGLFFLYALSIVPIAIAYFHIHVNPRPVQRESSNPLKEMKDGLLFTKNHSLILGNMIAGGVVSSLLVNFGTYGPLFADQVLHDGLSGFSKILFVIGLGSLISGLISGASKQNAAQSCIYYFGMAASLLLALISFVTIEPLALFLFAVLGFLLILFAINCTAAIQMNVPSEYQGRVMSVYNFVIMGAAPFGSLFVSTVLQEIGVAHGLLFIGLLSLVLTGWTFWKFEKA